MGLPYGDERSPATPGSSFPVSLSSNAKHQPKTLPVNSTTAASPTSINRGSREHCLFTWRRPWSHLRQMGGHGRLSSGWGVLLAVLVHVSWAAAETRICLNMIAKNEAKDIMDCLEPITPELSGWTLCDTGSTDDTIELVQGFFQKQGIPGTVANHAWEHFGHNRNLCIKAGVEWSLEEAKRQGMPSGSHYCDYLLFMDADQILQRSAEMQPGAIKSMDLKGNAYHMTEKGTGVTYKNLRLASTRVEWQWHGEVHEYVERKDGRHEEQRDIDGVWFHHDATGGQDGKRFVRDEVILAKAVQRRPTDTRARFYYANTLRALGKVEEAITHYIERIRLGGWAEERFMSALNIADQAKLQWEAGRLISPQVRAGVSNWDAYHMGDVQKDQEEEALLQSAVAHLKAVKDAAQEKLRGAQAGSEGKGDSKADAGSAAGKGSTGTTEEEDEQQEQGKQQSAKKADSKQQGEYSKQVMQDPAVQAAVAAVEKVKAQRKTRQFPLLVSAYLATAALLPYRPEPWVHLAKLYRQEKDDTTTCFNYASAALAQGPPHKNALFLNTYHATYEALDEMCACAYWVDGVLEEGRAACRKLESKLAAELQLHPDSDYRTRMLSRVKSNLGWYAKKAPQNARAEECPVDVQHLCAKDKQNTVEATVSEL